MMASVSAAASNGGPLRKIWSFRKLSQAYQPAAAQEHAPLGLKAGRLAIEVLVKRLARLSRRSIRAGCRALRSAQKRRLRPVYLL